MIEFQVRYKQYEGSITLIRQVNLTDKEGSVIIIVGCVATVCKIKEFCLHNYNSMR